jgi:hypothetical protein
MKTKQKIFLSLAAGLLATAASAQIIIVGHTFDGDGTNLAGDTVDTVAAGVATKWSASSAFNRDGSIENPGSGVHRSAFLALGSVMNDAKGQADGIFTLTTVFSSLSSLTTNSGWIASGLGEGTWDVTTSFASGTAGANGLASTMWDADPFGEVKVYDGPRTTGSASIGTDNTGSVTFTTVIDLSGWNGSSNYGTVAYSFNGGTVTNSAFTANQTFDNLVVSAFATGGAISSIQLTQVPEPSTYALLAGLATLGLVMLRRRRMR